MNRFFGAAILASSIALALGACGDDSDDSSGNATAADSCNQFTTCGSCTPQNGCGWCFDSTNGLCASTPDECTDVTEFTWTWDPSGCPDLDAGVAPLDAGDAGTSHVTPDSGTHVTADAGTGG